MRFSIIVPIYKVEEYLSQCVDSLLCQDYDNFEVILVDDGSPDNCPGICDAYAEKDARIKVVHKKNGGLSDARNAGIEVANGDYLCFVDSDDYWDDTSALSKLADNLGVYKSDVCQYYHKIYESTSNSIKVLPDRKLSSFNGLSTENLLTELVKKGYIFISAWATVISREYLLKHNLFFKVGIKTEDLEWAMRLFVTNPKITFINDVFYVYRKNRPGSITATVDYRHLCDYCDILENSIRLVEQGDKSLQAALFSYLMYHVLIVCALSYTVKLPVKQRKEILSRLKNISKDRITVYTLSKKVKLACKVYKCFGFSVMAKVVGFYLNYRKK